MGPHDAERRQSLGQYTSNCCCFSSLTSNQTPQAFPSSRADAMQELIIACTEKSVLTLVDYSNLGFNNTYSIDVAPNGILFGAKSIGKVQLKSKFGLGLQDSEKICAP